MAALASFLDARHNGGRWLLRFDDLDAPRVVPGSADDILRTLQSHALQWDGEPVWQSRRLSEYEAALEQLRAAGRVYACDCSRRALVGPYPGTCRNRPAVQAPHAQRFRLDDALICFDDRWQGPQAFEPRRIGDPVIRRRDGLFAYQLAVAVDDHAQHVTDVVRGADLLDSTPWQIALYRALGHPLPRYAHAPVVVEPDGQKLSKTRRSIAVEGATAGTNLFLALTLLGQAPPHDLQAAPAAEVVGWAIPNWQPQVLKTRTAVAMREIPLG